MYIEKITIKNFRSYYGTNTFFFKEGLNLVLGANGDGKTTFYDALFWAFSDGDGKIGSSVLSNEAQISAKLLNLMKPGEENEVRVQVDLCDGEEHKSVYKRFTVKKGVDGNFTIENWMHHCKLLRNDSKDEDDFQASTLLAGYDWFPPLVRKYSMFQGEGALKIFEETDNLKNLVTLFSNIKDLSPIKDFVRFAKDTSGLAIDRQASKNNSQQRELNLMRIGKEGIETRLRKAQERLAHLQKSLESEEKKLENVENFMDDVEKVHQFKQDIKSKKAEIANAEKELDNDYVAKMMSDMWILAGFNPILEQFMEKMNDVSQRKTQFINLYHMQKGERMAQKKAEAKAREDLKKQIMGLPWYIPDTKTMESMLKSHRCFVCNREMSEHDEAYKFMEKRLNEALSILSNKKEDDVKEEEIPYPFPFSNIDEIHTKAIEMQRRSRRLNEIPEIYFTTEIKNKQLQSKLDLLRSQLEGLEVALRDFKAQRNTGVDLDEMSENISTWKSISQSKEATIVEIHKLTEVDIPKLEADLKKASEDYEKELKKVGNKSGLEDFNLMFSQLEKTLERIENSFFERITTSINLIGNEFLKKLNVDDFTGELKLIRNKQLGKFKLDLYNSDGEPIKAPNTSLKTTMYVSALLAISELTKKQYENREYPMIFDAPTSSFDAGKEKQFYELFSKEIKKQVIIVTKSYLLKDSRTGEFVLDEDGLKKIDCPIYRINKLTGFDKKDLSTIDTQISKIK